MRNLFRGKCLGLIILLGLFLLLLGTGTPANADWVSYWNFDEGSGTTAYDSVGTNDGTIYGPQWVEGHEEKALDFDGSDDYVNLSNPSSLQPSGALTISAWVYREGDGTGVFNGIVTTAKKTGTSDRGQYGYLLLYYPAENIVRFYIDEDGAGDWKYADSNGDLAPDTWHYLTAVWENPTMILYINGEAQDTTGSANKITYQASTESAIGQYWWNGTEGFFNGIIDQVAIYDHALSASEVWEHYQSGIPPLPGYFEAGEDLNKNDALCLKYDAVAGKGKLYKANASDEYRMPAIGLSPKATNDGELIKPETVSGEVVSGFSFATGDIGKAAYVSSAIPGKLVTDPPASPYVQRMGIIKSSEELLLTIDGLFSDYAFRAGDAHWAETIGANSVTTDKIVNGAITTDDIGADQVTSTQLADNAVDGDKIDAQAITDAHIKDTAQIDPNKIKDIALTDTTGSVSSDNIADGTVATADIADGAITAAKTNIVGVDSTTGKITAINATNFSSLDGSQLTNLPSDGDWTISGNNVYRTTGNVGIGTTEPQEKLHLASGHIQLDEPNVRIRHTGSRGSLTLQTGPLSYHIFKRDDGKLQVTFGAGEGSVIAGYYNIGTTYLATLYKSGDNSNPGFRVHTDGTVETYNADIKLDSTPNIADKTGSIILDGSANAYFIKQVRAGYGDTGTFVDGATRFSVARPPVGGRLGWVFGCTDGSDFVTIDARHGYTTFYGGHGNASSKRWKTNVKPIEGALDKVERLKGVYFNWKKTGKHDIGMIAEEVGEIIPEVVAYEENGKDAKAMSYDKLVPVLVEAIKEQQQKISALEKAIAKLKKQQER